MADPGAVSPSVYDGVLGWAAQPFHLLEFLFFDMQTDDLPDSFVGGHLFRGWTHLEGSGPSALVGAGVGSPYSQSFGGNPWGWAAHMTFRLTLSNPISFDYDVTIRASDGDREHKASGLMSFFVETQSLDNSVQLEFGDRSGNALRIMLREFGVYMPSQSIRDHIGMGAVRAAG